jgi:hypothetical protein
MNKTLILFLLLSSFSSFALDGELRVGVRPIYFSNDSKYGADFWGYYKNNFDLNILSTDLAINIENRLMYDSLEGQDGQLYYMPTELNVLWQGEHQSLQVGSQQFAFSETFGVNLMDIMNPRDYRYSITDSAQYYRLAQWALNYKYLTDDYFFQLVWTPVPRQNRYPKLHSPFAFYSSLITKLNDEIDYDLSDGEVAVRGGLLFESGLDLSFLVATHQSRSLTYNVNVVPLSDISAQAISKRVTSSGMSATYVLDAFVFRFDTLLTIDDYLLGLNDSGHIVNTHFQSIIGGDWSSESGLQFGIQLHYDSHNSSEQSQWWSSFLFSKSFFQEKLFIEQIMFKGISNADWWLKSKLKWQTDSYSIGFIYNYLQGDFSDGGIGIFDTSDYLQISLEWIF